MKSQNLQHISKMGLDKYLSVVPLSHELIRYIPSFSFSFYWTNSNHEIVHVYDESTTWPEVAIEYHARFCNRYDDSAHPHLAQWHSKNSGAVHSRDFYFDTYYTSDSYKNVWSKLNYHHSLIASVKKDDSPVGILKLHRRRSEAPFSDEDKDKLSDALPLIADSLSLNNKNNSTPLVNTEVFGVLIADQSGGIRYVSPNANKLIYLCASSTAIAGKRNIKADDIDKIFTSIHRLCDRLNCKYENHPVGAIEKEYISNCWGGFTFIVSWLQVPEKYCDGIFCINIQYHEPSCIKMLRNCESYSLTFRQIQICILLSKSKTFDEIANELHVSSHTVIDHMKKVYNKLSVVSRSEVVQQLMLA